MPAGVVGKGKVMAETLFTRRSTRGAQEFFMGMFAQLQQEVAEKRHQNLREAVATRRNNVSLRCHGSLADRILYGQDTFVQALEHAEFALLTRMVHLHSDGWTDLSKDLVVYQDMIRSVVTECMPLLPLEQDSTLAFDCPDCGGDMDRTPKSSPVTFRCGRCELVHVVQPDLTLKRIGAA